MISLKAKNKRRGNIGKNARFDQSSPEQNDHLTLLIVKKILWSTKIGRGWSRTPVFQALPSQSTIPFHHLPKYVLLGLEGITIKCDVIKNMDSFYLLRF
jgi:hypothetical protein